MRLRYAVIGSGGQLGRCLVRELSQPGAKGELVAAFSHAELDIGSADEITHAFAKLAASPAPPQVILNAAAYNAVDACEGNSRRDAWRVNAEGPGLLARAAEALGARLVHVSTDYVLSGDAEAPYPEDSVPAPASEYGKSKLEGEQRVLAASADALVVRTSWVFGPGRNFVGAILRQARLRRSGEVAGPLSVVDDQRGCPTYSADLGQGLLALTAAIADKSGQGGVYHLCNGGLPDRVTSWWDFAREILDRTDHADLVIDRGNTERLDLPAPRPAYSVLGCLRAASHGVSLRSWPDALAGYLASSDLQTTLQMTDPDYWEDRKREAR